MTVTVVLLVVAIVLGASGPAGAAHPPSRQDRGYCAAFAGLLQGIAHAQSQADIQNPTMRRRAVALAQSPPRGLARATSVFSRSLIRLIDHGASAVTGIRQAEVRAASKTLGKWTTRHCAGDPQFAALRAETLRVRTAEANLRNGLTNAKGMYTDTDSYSSVSPDSLRAAEPSLHWVGGPTDPADPKGVSVHVVDPSHILMAAGTGTTCYFIRDAAMDAGTEFAKAAGTACDAAAPPSGFRISW